MGLLTVPIKLGIVARGLLISGCLAIGAYTSAMADMSYFTEANAAELATLQTGVCVGFMIIPAVCVWLVLYYYSLVINLEKTIKIMICEKRGKSL